MIFIMSHCSQSALRASGGQWVFSEDDRMLFAVGGLRLGVALATLGTRDNVWGTAQGQGGSSVVQFRAGSIEDTDAVLALFDANVAWLVERGRSSQWGSDPWSTNP